MDIASFVAGTISETELAVSVAWFQILVILHMVSVSRGESFAFKKLSSTLESSAILMPLATTLESIVNDCLSSLLSMARDLICM